MSGLILLFKTLTAGSGIILTPSAEELQIEASGGAGSGGLWSMRKSTDQTLTVSTDNLITFDTVVADSAGSVIDLTNNRFVVPATGLYLITMNWIWADTNPPAAAYMLAKVNGSEAPPISRQAKAVAFGSNSHVAPASLSLNDLVTMHINPSTTAGVKARGSASSWISTHFSLVRIT